VIVVTPGPNGSGGIGRGVGYLPMIKAEKVNDKVMPPMI